ncbi:MAG: MCP four helix bundle domain-containing protein, partial [Bacillota bacterium]
MLSKMKLAGKISLALGLVLVIALVIGGVGYWKISEVGSEAHDLGEEHLPGARALLHIHLTQMEINAHERTMLINGLDEATKHDCSTAIEEFWNGVETDWNTYAGVEKSPKEEKLWREFQAAWDDWKGKQAKTMELVNTGRMNEAIAYAMGEEAESFERCKTVVDQLMEENAAFAKLTHEQADRTVGSSKTIMVVAMIVGVLLSVVLGLFFGKHIGGIVGSLLAETKRLAESAVAGKLDARGDLEKVNFEFRGIIQGMNDVLDAVIRPVHEATGCLKEMAKGNLDVAVTGDYQGDHAIMKNALNTTVEALNEILSQVAVAVDQVAGGSQQIASSSQALSQGASESASSLEETTSSMQEITA